MRLFRARACVFVFIHKCTLILILYYDFNAASELYSVTFNIRIMSGKVIKVYECCVDEIAAQ